MSAETIRLVRDVSRRQVQPLFSAASLSYLFYFIYLVIVQSVNKNYCDAKRGHFTSWTCPYFLSEWRSVVLLMSKGRNAWSENGYVRKSPRRQVTIFKRQRINKLKITCVFFYRKCAPGKHAYIVFALIPLETSWIFTQSLKRCAVWAGNRFLCRTETADPSRFQQYVVFRAVMCNSE